MKREEKERGKQNERMDQKVMSRAPLEKRLTSRSLKDIHLVLPPVGEKVFLLLTDISEYYI